MNSYVIGQLADMRRDELIAEAANERRARASRRKRRHRGDDPATPPNAGRSRATANVREPATGSTP